MFPYLYFVYKNHFVLFGVSAKKTYEPVNQTCNKKRRGNLNMGEANNRSGINGNVSSENDILFKSSFYVPQM